MEAVKVKKVMTVSLCVDLPVAIPNIIGYTSLRKEESCEIPYSTALQKYPAEYHTGQQRKKSMWNSQIEENILYEDKEILVCQKPSGMPVQAAGIGTMDLESALKNYLAQKAPGKMPYLAVVHRLDQPVEGVLVFAKTPGAAGNLSKQMMAGGAGKYYLAVTEGAPKDQEGTLISYLKKNGRANMSQAVPENTPGAKKAILHYKVLDQKEINGKKRTLLKIKLETGRHHQIRVQLSQAGIPLLGDRKYNPAGEKGTSLGLCSCSLEFRHPKTGKSMKFQTEPQGSAFLDFVKKL